MADRLKAKRQTRRDAVDAARLKLQGDPSHINPREDRLLRETMPEAHGRVVTSGLLAEAGRGRDDRVTLLIPEEAALLKARGGSGAVNPRTGLLEYDDSDDDGNSGNTSNAGENTGGMDGTANSGVSEGPGANGGYGSNDGGYGGWGGYDQTPAIESVLAAPNFAMPGLSFTQYAPRDTWGRVVQEYFNPSIKPAGRYSPPTATSPGIFGSFLSQVTPSLSLGPVGVPAFGIAMNIGGAMGRASSPATQAASAREDAARSGHNSGGNQGSHSVLDMDAKRAARAAFAGAAPAGSASGAETADLGGGPGVPGITPAPGYTVNAAGQVVPTSESRNTATGLPLPVENLLADYIWRGRQGSGWGW